MSEIEVGLTELRRKFSEYVERASKGERIWIAKRGVRVAALLPPPAEADVKAIFARIEAIRRRSKKVRHVAVRSLIEEGRM